MNNPKNITELIRYLISLPEDLKQDFAAEVNYRVKTMKTFKLSDVLAYTSNPRLLAHINK